MIIAIPSIALRILTCPLVKLMSSEETLLKCFRSAGSTQKILSAFSHKVTRRTFSLQHVPFRYSLSCVLSYPLRIAAGMPYLLSQHELSTP